MRVLICGGRDLVDRSEIVHLINDLSPDDIVITGAAPGADTIAIHLASSRGLATFAFPADWRRHGKAAGPLRNQRMLDEGKPDVVYAFPTANSRGTWDMVDRARKAGLTVYVSGEK